MIVKDCDNCGKRYCGNALCFANEYCEWIPLNTDEIKVGDEVTVHGIKGIIVQEPCPIGANRELFVIVWYGQHMSSNSLKNVTLTGKHYPQIAEVLELLKGEK